ncbi:unnamed protein product [Gordionus sp. m RMFG-2023]
MFAFKPKQKSLDEIVYDNEALISNLKDQVSDYIYHNAKVRDSEDNFSSFLQIIANSYSSEKYQDHNKIDASFKNHLNLICHNLVNLADLKDFKIQRLQIFITKILESYFKEIQKFRQITKTSENRIFRSQDNIFSLKSINSLYDERMVHEIESLKMKKIQEVIVEFFTTELYVCTKNLEILIAAQDIIHKMSKEKPIKQKEFKTKPQNPNMPINYMSTNVLNNDNNRIPYANTRFPYNFNSFNTPFNYRPTMPGGYLNVGYPGFPFKDNSSGSKYISNTKAKMDTTY